MKNIIVEQHNSQGLLKTWKLKAQAKGLVFGSSKHADLRSADQKISGVQGRFEFRDGNWFFLNLSLDSKLDTETQLADNSEVEFENSKLIVRIRENIPSLIHIKNQGTLTKNETGKQPFQFFATYAGETLLGTSLADIKTEKPNQDWKSEIQGNLTIYQKTVYLNEEEAKLYKANSDMLQKGGKKTLAITLMGFMFLAGMFLIAPSNKNAGEAAVSALPPKEMRELKLTPPKKKKVAAAKPAQNLTPTPAPAAPQAGGGKAVSAIKAIGQSRISQLLGKVSAGMAKSNNIIVTNGVVAGSQPSGRSLASVGNIEKSGKDWSSESNKTGTQVSTKGIAGGKSLGSLGNLRSGNTGAGDAKLLEEESEIVGGLDREVIAQYIRTQLGQILYCYERQLSASPDLFGKVTVSFIISGTGLVETQKIGETTLKNATVEGCILQKVAKWKFPTPEGGTKVVVTYPFLFKSTN